MNKSIVFKSLILVLIFSLTANYSFACEIDFKILGDKKETYKVGDELIIKIHVEFTHDPCPEGIEKTKFETDGIKILQATKWKEVKPLNYERKLKVKITGTKDGKLVLSATRTCDKDGGFGDITILAEPLKK